MKESVCTHFFIRTILEFCICQDNVCITDEELICIENIKISSATSNCLEKCTGLQVTSYETIPIENSQLKVFIANLSQQYNEYKSTSLLGGKIIQLKLFFSS